MIATVVDTDTPSLAVAESLTEVRHQVRQIKDSLRDCFLIMN